MTIKIKNTGLVIVRGGLVTSATVLNIQWRPIAEYAICAVIGGVVLTVARDSISHVEVVARSLNQLEFLLTWMYFLIYFLLFQMYDYICYSNPNKF